MSWCRWLRRRAVRRSRRAGLRDSFRSLVAGVRLSRAAARNRGDDFSSSARAVALAQQISHGEKHAAYNRQGKKDAKKFARTQRDFSVAYLIGLLLPTSVSQLPFLPRFLSLSLSPV